MPVVSIHILDGTFVEAHVLLVSLSYQSGYEKGETHPLERLLKLGISFFID